MKKEASQKGGAAGSTAECLWPLPQYRHHSFDSTPLLCSSLSLSLWLSYHSLGMDICTIPWWDLPSPFHLHRSSKTHPTATALNPVSLSLSLP